MKNLDITHAQLLQVVAIKNKLGIKDNPIYPYNDDKPVLCIFNRTAELFIGCDHQHLSELLMVLYKHSETFFNQDQNDPTNLDICGVHDIRYGYHDHVHSLYVLNSFVDSYEKSIKELNVPCMSNSNLLSGILAIIMHDAWHTHGKYNETINIARAISATHALNDISCDPSLNIDAGLALGLFTCLTGIDSVDYNDTELFQITDHAADMYFKRIVIDACTIIKYTEYPHLDISRKGELLNDGLFQMVCRVRDADISATMNTDMWVLAYEGLFTELLLSNKVGSFREFCESQVKFVEAHSKSLSVLTVNGISSKSYTDTVYDNCLLYAKSALDLITTMDA